jgi:hypothetical protein
MSRLSGRVSRLEQGGWFADFKQRCLRVLREAATAVELAPTEIEQLCTALAAQLCALSATVPAWIRAGPQMTTLGERTVGIVRAIVESHVDETQRSGLYAALSQAFDREAHR